MGIDPSGHWTGGVYRGPRSNCGDGVQPQHSPQINQIPVVCLGGLILFIFWCVLNLPTCFSDLQGIATSDSLANL